MALSVATGNNQFPLQPGDVLLKRSTGAMAHLAIVGGQAVTGFLGGKFNRTKYSNTVHAGIYSADTAQGGTVLESVGAGVREEPYTPGNTYDWKVYRFTADAALVTLAVEVGLNLVRRSVESRNTAGNADAYGKYNTGKAVGSLFNPSRTPNHAAGGSNISAVIEQRGFFCSNFVAACFAIASEATNGNPYYAIPKNMENVNPAELDEYFKLNGNWSRVGAGQAYLRTG